MDRFEAWLSTMDPRRLAWMAVLVSGIAAAAAIAVAPPVGNLPAVPVAALDWVVYMGFAWLGLVARPDHLFPAFPLLTTMERAATTVLFGGGLEVGFDIGLHLFPTVGNFPTGAFPLWLLPIHVVVTLVVALAWLALTRRYDTDLRGAPAPIRRDIRRAAGVLLLGTLFPLVSIGLTAVNKPA